MSDAGAVEGIHDGAVVGWVRTDGRMATPPVVELLVNDRPAGLGRADRPIADAPGRLGFVLPFPGGVRPGDRLDVRLANTDRALDGSPVLADRHASRPHFLRGEVDRAEGLVIHGWVQDQRNPDAYLSVVAFHQGREVGRARADLFRGDLLEAGIAGNHAFRLCLPLAFGDGQPHRIDVLFDAEGGRFPLGGVDVFVRPEGPTAIARLIAGQAERTGPPAIAAGARILEAMLAEQGRRHPLGLSFREYASWAAVFPPPPAPASASAIFTIVIDGVGPGTALGDTVASLRTQTLPPRRVAVLVRTAGEAEAASRLGADLILVDRQAAARALATLLPEADGFLVPLAAGDTLHPDCLRHFAAVAERADIVYADSDVAGADPDGTPPHFKPDWNYDLFLSGNYMAPAWAVHRRALTPAEPIDWADIPYRVVERSRPGAILHLPYVLGRQMAMPPAPSGEEALRALAGHIRRAGHAAAIVTGDHPAVPYRISWTPPSVRPTVSLIVPTRDRVELLSQCLDSLRGALRTGRVECLIVDNGSERPETHHYFRQVAALPGVRVVPQPGPFNYSAINNAAASQARGDILGFINNDVVIPPHERDGSRWLDEILGYFQRRDVGGVGIKLLYDDGFVQHGGVILGTNGLADHAFRRLRHDEAGYWGRAVKAQQFSAVTAAALFVRRSQFFEVGGFNERDLPVAFNDVDLCLKLRHRGLAIVWTPHVWAFHLESASRGTDVTLRKHDRMERENAFLRGTWGPLLDHDPFYNPNLCGDDHPFGGLALPPRRPFGMRPLDPPADTAVPDAPAPY